MKIVLLDGLALNDDLNWDSLKELGECRLYDRTPVDDNHEIINRISHTPIVLTHKTPINAEVIHNSPQLKYIGIMGTGYDVVDVKAAKEAGITVTTVPTYASDAVAQFTFALLLEVTNHVISYQNGSLNNQLTDFKGSPLTVLRGKTFGLIGYGAIAQRVAQIAHAFSMTVIFYNHRPKTVHEKWLQQVSLDELLTRSDVISLHVIQTPQTINLINQTTINLMKSNVILLNTARGKLINEADLAAALNSGRVGAAALDVVSSEPIKSDNPLLTATNCMITPHIAWASQETRARLLAISVDNLKEFLAGRQQNIITYK
ncbi:MAG: D-2-hydroxyacid dehydrogenase [Lentilactobacillus diolivorans]|jgi:glycerate dehydrogenase|nr:D-2-hydroxyacid dehydrogenase [Lentilactobacillus diolivorans]RRG02592.1 MAG: D-2-hydroxyacid dehydrogenase [Lactobacillus sp.]